MGDAGTSAVGKIKLYTNHSCPWAHRTHIVLKELGLPYEETLIDLEVPRPEWYLKINPRGLVPAIVYEHPSLPQPLTVIESSLSVQFLSDLVPEKSQRLWPAPTSIDATFLRYRINLFVDNYINKVHSNFFPMMFASGTPEHDARAEDYVQALREYIEPLLHDAAPFFGGSEQFTLAEVQTASFVLRLYDFIDGVIEPKSLASKLDQLPNFSKWAKAVVARESVTYIWKKEFEIERVKRIMPIYKEKYGKK